MTRFEYQIAEAIKNSSDTDYINMLQKVKTRDGYIYTIAECKYPKETMSEAQYFEFLYKCACTHMSCVRETMLTEKLIWTMTEGRIIHADNIKEVWIEFNNDGEMSIALEENNSIGTSAKEALSVDGLKRYQETGTIDPKASL